MFQSQGTGSRPNTSQNQDQRTLPDRRTGCFTCDEGYLAFVPPPRDPRLLRQDFRRRPFGPPRQAPPHVLDSLNHAYIAPMAPAVVPGQGRYPFLTDFQRRGLERSGRGGFTPDDEEGWGIPFLLGFFKEGFTSLLATLIALFAFIGAPVNWLFDPISRGPFLPVFTTFSIYIWLTGPAPESLWAGRAFLALIFTGILMTLAKFALRR
ncbi:hypothetical protein NHQ30_000962 [Ciborinia camelliae]|nr:hypothetical protein NHQ30_000962 [Ciborinia camelliae]